MRLELTEVLVCPKCGPGSGLILFVDRADGRRIVDGHLDCPICETRHPIAGGVVYLGGQRPAPRSDPDPATGHLCAALLGSPGGPELILAGPGTEGAAPALADLRPEALVITFGRAGPRHARVHALIGPGEARFPLRSGRMQGVVVAGGCGVDLAEAVRVLAPGSHLVVVRPGDEARSLLASLGLRELASDERAWVGVAGGGALQAP